MPGVGIPKFATRADTGPPSSLARYTTRRENKELQTIIRQERKISRDNPTRNDRAASDCPTQNAEAAALCDLPAPTTFVPRNDLSDGARPPGPTAIRATVDKHFGPPIGPHRPSQTDLDFTTCMLVRTFGNPRSIARRHRSFSLAKVPLRLLRDILMKVVPSYSPSFVSKRD